MLLSEFEKESFTTESVCKTHFDQYFLVKPMKIPIFLKKKTKKWNRHEDIQLSEYVAEYGENWMKIKRHFPDKSESEIKHRYLTHFSPSLNKDKFSKSEDERIVRLQMAHGNKWTLIAKSFPNRNANMIKNRYHSKLKHLKLHDIPERKESPVPLEKGSAEGAWKNKIFHLDFIESPNTLTDPQSNKSTLELERAKDKMISKIDKMLSLIHKMKNNINQQFQSSFIEERDSAFSIENDLIFKEYGSFI